MSYTHLTDTALEVIPIIAMLASTAAAISTVLWQFFSAYSRKKIAGQDQRKKIEYYDDDVPLKKAELSFHLMALMKDYHAQSLAQSKISFLFSLVFASVGFSLIAYSVILFTNYNNGVQYKEFTDAVRPGFALISGTVIDVVAGLFFVQSNRARIVMAEFFDKLRADRKIDEALRLAGNINNEEIQSYVKATIALHFIDFPQSSNAFGDIADMIKNCGAKPRSDVFPSSPTD